jgi:hypothetical protein
MPNIGYNQIVSGEISGSTSAKQLPDIDCELVNIKAQRANSGNVYIGASTVTVIDGTEDTTSGFELDAGEETGWIAIPNLNLLYLIGNNAGDDLTYLALTHA